MKVLIIQNNQPITLRGFIMALETALEQKAVKNHLPMQLRDER